MAHMMPEDRDRDLASLREELKKPMSDYYTSTPSIAKRVAASIKMHKTMDKTHESAEILGRGKPYGDANG